MLIRKQMNRGRGRAMHAIKPSTSPFCFMCRLYRQKDSVSTHPDTETCQLVWWAAACPPCPGGRRSGRCRAPYSRSSPSLTARAAGSRSTEGWLRWLWRKETRRSWDTEQDVKKGRDQTGSHWFSGPAVEALPTNTHRDTSRHLQWDDLTRWTKKGKQRNAAADRTKVENLSLQGKY